MTNKELYEIAKDCYIDSDNTKLRKVLPGHYLCRDEKFILCDGIKLSHGSVFDVVRDSIELSLWADANYKSSGIYSDDLLVVLVPDAPGVRLEIKDKRLVRALLINGSGDCIDITHNIHFLKSIPLSLLVADSGCIHGAVISTLPEEELYKLLISPLPDESILDCEFVAVYTYFIPSICDTTSNAFEFLKNLGFKIPISMVTNIPKWNRTIESAKLAAGSGSIGYKCSRVLTLYNNIKMVELFGAKTTNRWGVLTNISMGSLFEVVGVTWDTNVKDNKICVIPVITFKFGHNLIVNYVKDQTIEVNIENNMFHKRVVDFNVGEIDRYCVGDMFVGSLANDNTLFLERRYGSGKVPLVAPSCPKCGNGVDLRNRQIFCVNIKCPAVIVTSIREWVNRFCVNVDGYALLNFLRGFEISGIADIYSIADSGDMLLLEYIQIFDGVVNSRNRPKDFFMVLMPFLSVHEAETLSMPFSMGSPNTDGVIDHIFTMTTLSSMGMHDVAANKIIHFFEQNRMALINVLRKYYQFPGHHPLYGRTFIIEGLLYERDIAKYAAVIYKHGGRVIAGVVPYVTGFLLGKFAGADTINRIKEFAKNRDIAIYSEEEFTKQFIESQKEEVRNG